MNSKAKSRANLPCETQEGALPGDDPVEAGDGEEPEEPEEPQEPYQIVLQGFRTVSKTLSMAYGAASSEIQTVIRKSLAKATAETSMPSWWTWPRSMSPQSRSGLFLTLSCR